MSVATTLAVAFVIAVCVALAFVARLAWVLHEQSDWTRLRQVQKGARVHLPTDPVCVRHVAPPRPGTRLHRAAAGVPCPLCDRTETDGPW